MKLTANDIRKMEAMTNDECVGFLRGKLNGNLWQRALRSVVKPVHRHPQRLAHEWRTAMDNDPQRPLEPGEDAAGNLTSYVLLKDFKCVGRKVFKNVVIAAALILAIAGGASAQTRGVVRLIPPIKVRVKPPQSGGLQVKPAPARIEAPKARPTARPGVHSLPLVG